VKMAYLDQTEADDLSATSFKHISLCATEAVDCAAIARELGPGCDSHIEVALGVKIKKALCVIGDKTLTLKPRYFLGRYIYDLAIFREGRSCPIIVVECDGKEFHSTPEQLENDARKTQLAWSKGIIPLRFTGTEIHRTPDDCLAKILQTMRYKSQLTQAQCNLLDAAGVRRHPPLPAYARG
jgi:very-short-patch-repair endonuclease